MPIAEAMAALLETHIRTEEEWMLSIGYPHASGHRWQHEVIASDMQHVLDVIRSGSQRDAAELAALLRRITIEHMEETDIDLIRFWEMRPRKGAGPASD